MEPLVISPTLQIPGDEFEFTYTRSSGPGGQNVNKVSSRAVLRWNPATSQSLPEGVRQRFLGRFHSKLTSAGDLLIASQRYRDQPRNIADCLEKLRLMLEQSLTPPTKRKPTRPGKGARERRLKDKRERAQRKDSRRNFPMD